MDDNIAKNVQNLLSYVPTGNITDRMALKFFPGTILLLNINQFEGILNRIKIDGMVKDQLSSCNS